jgi:23S rRNA (cytidine1920-2'-O)/16S rRNA (cytidine1409-2'-O)-methyltransferase
MEEERIDKIIMERKLVSSRVRAEELISKFGVLVNGKLISKPGKKVPVNAEIQLISEEIPWVSKGALKLVAAIDEWSFDCTNKVFIDLGASTGGFTEVLLSKGAKKVFGVDVGSNQMHERIKTDERVINLEKTHARDLTEKQITEEIDGLVVDVSFISLEKVIPFVIRFLKPNSDVVLLIKPQFELGRAFLSKGGIVKDVRQYPILLETIKSMCERNQLEWQAYIDSPILGGDGNKEFLGYFKRK